MKKLFILSLFLIIISGVSAQKKLNEKQSIQKDHIDFTKECVCFKISGLIEIGGHTFKNDTCKFPIIFFAGIEGVTISDTIRKRVYEHHKCDEKGCNVIHLKLKVNELINGFGTITTPGIIDPGFYQPSPYIRRWGQDGGIQYSDTIWEGGATTTPGGSITLPGIKSVPLPYYQRNNAPFRTLEGYIDGGIIDAIQ